MRPIVVTLIFALAGTCAGTLAAPAVEGCRTGDSAICISDPNCHWNPERRGCYEGAPPHQDACAAHSDQNICDTDLTIGCKWDAENKQCKSAK
jgi:hypothetical protein